MKTSILAFAAIGGWAALASAQTDNASATFTLEQSVRASAARPVAAPWLTGAQSFGSLASDPGVYRLSRLYSLEYLALADMADPSEGGPTGSTANLLGGGGMRSGREVRFYKAPVKGLSAGASYTDRISGDRAHRAWGLSVGLSLGAVTLRAAHQNRNVAKVRLFDRAGNNMDARNSLIAASLKYSWGTAYTGYSINRGWGSTPLFNPDNPYGASFASTPSTDSRDVLLGVAVPVGHATTVLASFIRRNDRDLSNRDANQFALGASYAVSRRTDFYAAYTHIQNRGGAGLAIDGIGTKNSAISVGMRHAF